jgi:hypothetical protein
MTEFPTALEGGLLPCACGRINVSTALLTVERAAVGQIDHLPRGFLLTLSIFSISF